MGFHTHTIHVCHTCKRRLVSGGPKKAGSWEEARRIGWVFMVRSTLGKYIWLCPTCARKLACTELPIGTPRRKRKQV